MDFNICTRSAGSYVEGKCIGRLLWDTLDTNNFYFLLFFLILYRFCFSFVFVFILDNKEARDTEVT